MVYIERQAADIDGGLADLITFDLNSGVELSRDRIANFGDRIVAFDGPRVVITRQRANPELPPSRWRSIFAKERFSHHKEHSWAPIGGLG